MRQLWSDDALFGFVALSQQAGVCDVASLVVSCRTARRGGVRAVLCERQRGSMHVKAAGSGAFPIGVRAGAGTRLARKQQGEWLVVLI